MAPTLYSPVLLSAVLFFAKNAHALTLNRRQAELPGTWAPNGCYTDISSGRTLIAASFADPTMTVESCLAFCTDAGTHYAGVENGNECWCDFAIQNPGVPAEDTECNVPCAGDPLETCGAGGRMNMFYDGTPDPIAVPVVDTWVYKGCFKFVVRYCSNDSMVQVLLHQNSAPLRARPPVTLLPDLNSLLNAVRNLSQSTCSAVLINGTYLGCGHELTDPVLVDDSDCKMACAGDHTAFCGGSNRITVYEDTPADPDPTTTTDPTPTSTDPTTTDPTPTSTDPTTTDPTPTPTDPTTTDPLPTSTDPTTTDPIPTSTDPTTTDPTPTPTDPTTTDPTPIPTDPTTTPTDPTTEPTTTPTDPTTDPVPEPTDPVPTTTEPTDPEPTTTEPTDPEPTEPAPEDPIATDEL